MACFADINECLLNSHTCTCGTLTGCAAFCIDTEGSYTCGCSAGFDLAADGQTCIGTAIFLNCIYIAVQYSQYHTKQHSFTILTTWHLHGLDRQGGVFSIGTYAIAIRELETEGMQTPGQLLASLLLDVSYRNYVTPYYVFLLQKVPAFSGVGRFVWVFNPHQGPYCLTSDYSSITLPTAVCRMLLSKQCLLWDVVDFDECFIGTHACTCGTLAGCTPLCFNIDGTYTCGCPDTFVLDIDGITCVGRCTWNMPVFV